MSELVDLGDVLNVIRPKTSWAVTNGNLRWLSDPSTKPSDEEIEAEREKQLNELPMKLLRRERDELLRNCDVYGLVDYPEGEKKELWKAYRQALRELPQTQTPTIDTNGMLVGITFPTPPS